MNYYSFLQQKISESEKSLVAQSLSEMTGSTNQVLHQNYYKVQTANLFPTVYHK